MSEALSSAGWEPVRLCGTDMWRAKALPEEAGVAHVFTPHGFNMSLRSGPDVDGTPRRIEAVCAALGLDAARLCGGVQVHGTRVVRVGAADSNPAGAAGCRLDEVDGLITDVPGVPLMALSADCPLMLVYDGARKALGLAHSGWRGTLAGMPRSLVASMVEVFGCEPAGMVAAIAPCARACCYEIQEDVRRQLADAVAEPERFIRRSEGRTPRERPAGSWMSLDLEGLIADQLGSAGLAAEAIHGPDHCTICDQRFHSYRREGAGVGHAALIAALRRE